MKMYRYILVSIFLCRCGATQTSEQKAVIANSSGELAHLGMGYDIVQGQVTGNHCLNVFSPQSAVKVLDETSLAQQASAELKFERNMNFDDLNKALSGSLRLEIPVYPGVTAIGSVSMASHFAAQKYNETITLNFNADLGGSKIVFDDLLSLENASKVLHPRLYEVKQQIAQNPQQLTALEAQKLRSIYLDMCGDEYISYIRKGVSIVAVMKFEFKNEYDRKQFAGSLGASLLGIVDVNVSMGFESIDSSSQGTVSIFVQQRGGDPTKLLSVLQQTNSTLNVDPNGSSPSGFLECSLGDSIGASPCIQSFKKIVQLARDIKQDISNDQLHKYLERAVPILVETKAYPHVGPTKEILTPGQLSAGVAEAIRAERQMMAKRLDVSRKSLLQHLSIANGTIRRVDALLKKIGALDAQLQSDQVELKATQDKMLQARVLINSALEYCNNSDFNGAQDLVSLCESKATSIAQSFERGEYKINFSLLSPEPRTFYSWCVLSHIPNVLNLNDIQTVKVMLKKNNQEMIALNLNEDSDEIEQLTNRIKENCTIAQNFYNQSGSSLDLSRAVNGNMMVSSLRPLNSLNQLQILIVKNQFVNSILGLYDLAQLRRLDFTDNKFEYLDEFSQLKSTYLTDLILSHNLIQSIPSNITHNFTLLDLSHNKIERIESFQAPRLSNLNLTNNFWLEDVSALNQVGLPQMTINLSGNSTSCNEITARQCVKEF